MSLHHRVKNMALFSDQQWLVFRATL